MKEAELSEVRAKLKARILDIVGAAGAAAAGEVADAAEIPRFEEALTHPSFANESAAPDNQRLEFLGDAVLGLCVSELLVRSQPEADEGALTRMRSALVNAEALARWARSEGIGDALALGKGARSGTEREQTNVLADAVEALVASVYDARGLDGARKLVEHVVRDPMQEAAHLGSRDPKSLLQEQVQARGLAAPTYRVKEMRGPQHDPTFAVEVLIGNEVLGVGEGRSKRVAERAAALVALSTEPEASDLSGRATEQTAEAPPASAEDRDPRRTGGAR